MDKLPVYKIKVNTSLENKEGIDFVSLVDFPAIESNWVAFNQVKHFRFDKEKQMLYGAILIPNKPIYRNDNGLEYYVVFEEEEITNLVRKFQAQGKTVNLNYQHKKDSQIENAIIQEIWLTGSNDKSKDFGFDFPVNTAMVGVYIGDKKFWNEEVKTGNVRGFSIEGWLDMEIKNKIQNMNKQKFVSATTKSGVVVSTEAEAFAVGVEVYTENESGEKGSVPDGEHELENGSVITVEGNKITAMTEAPEQVDEEMAEVIQKAVEPVTAALSAQIKELTEKLTALEVKFSNQPGQPVKKEIAKPVELSKIERVKILLNKKQK